MAVKTIEEMYLLMQGFTQMTEELPFNEFADYYQNVMDTLQADYQKLSQEDLIRVKGICTIMDINAQSRAGYKDDKRKRFQKMSEKSRFWGEAIKSRLLKEGMTSDQIMQAEAALWADQQ
ncbi:MAG: hypothetical protein PHN35_06970 [Clostridia bacterium]|nr:hypothetical protein [Clostridia bacterium]MDD4799081.1 hypothetical protein [Clostridia bacterium]